MAGTKMAGPPTQLVVDGKTITSPLKMAEAINTHYVNKIKSTREELGEPTSDPCAGLRRMVKDKQLENTLTVKAPTRRQLADLVSSMKPTKSAGYDDINMKIIKDYYSVLEEPLHHFVTRVIETQDYPQAIKVSRVVPLLKAPDLNTTDCKSYRRVNI